MFKKNMELIDNQALKSRLNELTLEESRWDISFCMTPTNDYLLMKNDFPIDDVNDPRGAIRKMLSDTIKQPMGSNDIIVTFGIGLCYLLDEVYNTYPSKIFVYEPDIKLLHFVLNNVDISEILSSGRVFITDKADEIIKKLNETYITKDKVEVVYLNNYAIAKSQELLEFTQKVYDTCRSKMVDVNTILKFSRIWLKNILNNIKAINSSSVYKLCDLENKFIGQTALIIAAGPSFQDNIQKIKENRDKYVIFAVNRVFRTLIANDIIPDFVVCLDAENLDASFTNLEDWIPKVNCIMDLKSDSGILQKNFKRIFLSFTGNETVIKKLLQYNQSLISYECGGSTTTLAFIAAVKMGFEKIIFSGLDLAIKGDVMYSSGETANRTADGKINLGGDQIKGITKVKSVTGEMVESREDFATFIQHFEAMIKDLNFSEIYNTTTFGADIQGMKNVQFENIPLNVVSNTTSMILNTAMPFKIETQAWSQDELKLINDVIELLSKNTFSPALVSAIVKSSLLYQYMQAEVIKVLQSKMDDGLAEGFIEDTKTGIKIIIDMLQKNHLI
ncbi:motility associated factor glycosyltransferase family protein [bacterium]|nr:motility associated factor glycosyltransferase family protein [bacterium]